MLELIAIAGGGIIVASVLIGLYRWIFAFKGVNHKLVSFAQHKTSRRIAHQQGYVRATANARALGQAKEVRRPWGW